MNKKELERFRKLIEAEKQKVLQDLGMIEEEIDSMSSGKGSGSQGYSNHMADIGTDAMEQEQTFLHASQGTDYLRSLIAALKRIEDGSYGKCEECGGKIPLKRLEAYPAASLCISCKSRLEKLQRG
jgi:DnaK suppressor protein